jgi:hypothetical protein
MGADIEAMIELPDGSFLRVYGKAVGSNGTPDIVRVLVRGYADKGVPDAMYGVDAKNARKVEGLLPEGYAEGKGAKAATPAGRVISDGRKPQKLSEMESAPITPDDERMAEQGSNAPEAQGGKDYETSPEGQQVIANLSEEDADVATSEEVADLLDGEKDLSGYKGLKEISPGVYEYKVGSDRYRITERRDGRWNLSAERSNSDYSFDTAADRRNMRGTFESVGYDGGADSVEQIMDDFFAADYTPKKPKKSSATKQEDANRDPRYGKSDLTEHNLPFNDKEFTRPGASTKTEEDITVNSVAGISSRDGMFEATNYIDGSIKKFETEQEARDWVNNEFNGVNDAENEREATRKDEERKAADKADREARTTPPMKRDEFRNAAVEAAMSSGARDTIFDEPNEADVRRRVAALGDEKEMADAYQSYLDNYREAYDADGVVDEDMNNELFSSVLDDFFPEAVGADPMDDILNEAIGKAMNGEDPGSIEEIMGEAKKPKKKAKKKKEETFDDEEDDFGDGPSDQDLLDIENEGLDEVDAPEVEFDPAELLGTRKSSEAIPAGELREGDVVLFQGEPAKVMKVEPERDFDDELTGKIALELRKADGTSYFSDKDEFADMTLLEMEKGADAPESITPETVTPEVDAPETDAPEPEAPRIAPDTASKIDPKELEVGDTVYSSDGTERLGVVTAVNKKSDGTVDFTYDAGDGSKPQKDRDNFRPILVEKGEKAVEPEAPKNVDEPTANAAGFTESSRDRLRGMKAESGGPMRQAYAKALANGRTSTIAQDIDGSWHMEKHDAFNGGILETKRFGSLQEALDEGNAFLDNKDPKFDAPEPEAVVEPVVTVEPKTPVTPKKKTGKKAKIEKEEERPEDVPLPPADRVDDGVSDIDWPDGKPDTDPGRPDRLRTDKVLPEFDQYGRPLFLSDSNNAFVEDENGNLIPITDEEAFRGLIYEFYPDAKTTADGMRTILKRFKDVNGDTVELSVSRSNGGRSLLELRLTSPDGTEERYVHYDDRASFAGLHGLKNSPQMIMDILTGKENRSAGSVKNTAKMETVRQRFRYFRAQIRKGDKTGRGAVKTFATLAETWTARAEGRAKIINTSKNAGLSLRQRELPDLWSALDRGIASGNLDDAYFRARAFAGSVPQDLGTLAELRSWMRGEVAKRYPNLSATQTATIANAVSAQMRTGVIETGNRRERPFMSADGSTPVATGQWVEYTNADGVKSYGVVTRRNNSNISNPTQVEGDFQYRNNVDVEFGDGQVVTNLSSVFLRVLDDPERRKRLKEGAKDFDGMKPGTKTKYTPGLSGAELREQRMAEVLFERGEDSEDDFEPNLGTDGISGEDLDLPEDDDSGSTAGGPVKGLREGDTFYGKDGTPLGKVVSMRMITGKSGKRGLSILYVDENGEDVLVNVGEDEVRGPKA